MVGSEIIKFFILLGLHHIYQNITLFPQIHISIIQLSGINFKGKSFSFLENAYKSKVLLFIIAKTFPEHLSYTLARESKAFRKSPDVSEVMSLARSLFSSTR